MTEKLPPGTLAPVTLSSLWTIVASLTLSDWAMILGMIATCITLVIAIHRAILFDRAMKEHRARAHNLPPVLCDQCPLKP